MLFRSHFVYPTAVYSVFVDWFNKNKDILGIEGIFKDIVKYAEYYYIIYKQEIKTVDAKIRNSVREFRYILSEMPAPLFMELYSLIQQGSVTMEQFDDIMRIYNHHHYQAKTLIKAVQRAHLL